MVKKSKSVNVVHLGGWLTIEKVHVIPISGRQMLSIVGWIHTRKPASVDAEPQKTSYPVVFAGTPADIILARAKTDPGQPVKVITSGRLYREADQCFVKVEYVEILDVRTGPLDPEAPRPTVVRRA